MKNIFQSALKAIFCIALLNICSCGKAKEDNLQPEPGTMDAESTVDVRSAGLDTVQPADTIVPVE